MSRPVKLSDLEELGFFSLPEGEILLRFKEGTSKFASRVELQLLLSEAREKGDSFWTNSSVRCFT
jgi:hypothetical protein